MTIPPVTVLASHSLLERGRHVLAVLVTLALFALLVAGIASTYVGHGRSPYDTCYGANGRAVSCRALPARQ